MTSSRTVWAGRGIGGLVAAAALVLLVPGQAFAEQPVPPTAESAPATVSSVPATPAPVPVAVTPPVTPAPAPGASVPPQVTRTPEAVPGGQVSRLPVGAADTGATGTDGPDGPLLALGTLGLAGAAGAGAAALHRRRRETTGR